MGRKSRSPERRSQIVEAFERCVVDRGLEGTTLDHVAAEAGLPRSLVRHYVGNRAGMIRAAVEDLTAKYGSDLERAARTRGASDSPSKTIAYLFKGGFVGNRPHEDRVIDTFLTAAVSDPQVRESLREMYQAFELFLRDQLVSAYPNANAANVRRVAYALMCLAEQNSSFLWMGFPRQRATDVHRIATQLVESLAKGGG